MDVYIRHMYKIYIVYQIRTYKHMHKSCIDIYPVRSIPKPSLLLSVHKEIPRLTTVSHDRQSH